MGKGLQAAESEVWEDSNPWPTCQNCCFNDDLELLEEGVAAFFLWNLCLFLGVWWICEIQLRWARSLGCLWPTKSSFIRRDIYIYSFRDLKTAMEYFNVWRDLSVVSANSFQPSKGRHSTVFWTSLKKPWELEPWRPVHNYNSRDGAGIGVCSIQECLRRSSS